MEEFENDLDISWIETHEKIIHTERQYKKELQKNITLFTVYLNEQDEIEAIEKQKYDLVPICKKGEGDEEKTGLSADQVLYLIQKNKERSNKKYSLFQMLLYSVEVEIDHLNKLLSLQPEQYDTDVFFHILPLYDSIDIPPSLFLFHSLNALYFVFKERHSKPVGLPLKSILKTRKDQEPPLRKTKTSR
jgi:hypothetical protein